MSHRTAVVILNWNTRKLLEQFLPSILQFSDYNAEIIVADNGSTDGSIEFLKSNYPTVRIISNEKNEGYTGGYNAALKQVHAEYFVLINSDVMVTENWLKSLVDFMDKHPETGACQPKILSFNTPENFEYAGAAGGYIDKYGYPFCRGRIFTTIEKDIHQYNDSRKIFWATGACMMVRSDIYKNLDGLDPNFFAHMEEIDFCWRIQLSGKDIYYCADSIIYHVGGGSLPKSNPRKTYLNFRNNLLLIHKNAIPKTAKRILRLRFFLDYLASIMFLFSGSFADSRAVWNARSDFQKLKTNYPSGKASDGKNIYEKEFMIYPKSIVWQYYICGKKKFSSLRWKK